MAGTGEWDRSEMFLAPSGVIRTNTERLMAAQGARAGIYSDKAMADVALVQRAMNDWRQANEPADHDGLTMAEAVVIALYARGRLK